MSSPRSTGSFHKDPVSNEPFRVLPPPFVSSETQAPRTQPLLPSSPALPDLGGGDWPARPVTPYEQSPGPPAVPANTRPGRQVDVGLELPFVRREGRGWKTSLGEQALTGSSVRQSD